MKPNNVYEDLKGTRHSLAELDDDERRLVNRLRRRARTQPDWFDFGNYWMRAVAEFYDARGMSRKQSKTTLPFRIAQDLSSRLGIAGGYIQPPDYRGELEELIDANYKSRREFCKAAGISEDMLCHVLAGRKDLSISSLEDALGRIGYRLRIVPAANGGTRGEGRGARAE